MESISPAITINAVDLPDLLAPRRETISPAPTPKESRSTAGADFLSHDLVNSAKCNTSEDAEEEEEEDEE